jgi:hypothetical protein
MAVSIDDNRLFVSEAEAKKIEVFSLPSLTLLKTLNVAHEPVSDRPRRRGTPVHQQLQTRRPTAGRTCHQIDANTGRM